MMMEPLQPTHHVMPKPHLLLLWLLLLLCTAFPTPGACMMMEFGYNGQFLETFSPLGLANQ
jgi:hypothetical protein